MSCKSCAQCNLIFGYSENNIVAFSNGECTHGSCADKYQQRTKNKELKIVSRNTQASRGLVMTEVLLANQVNTSS